MNTRLILISCLSLASVLAPAYAASTTNTPSLAGLTNPPIVPGVVRIQSNSVVTAGGASNIYNALVGIGSIFGAPFTNLTIGSTDYLTLTLSSGGTGATLSITGGNITNLASFMGSNLLVVTPAFAATNYLSLSSWSSWLSTNGLASLAAVNSLFQQTTNDFNALLAGMPSFSGTNFWSATGSNAFNGPVGMGVLSMTNYTAYSNGVQTIDGTITVSSSSSNVVGAPGSLFLSQVAVGNILYSGNDSIYVAEGIVASIESDEALTLQTNAVNNYSGVGAGIDAMLPYTRPPRLIFPDGEQSNAFLATSTQLNSIFGYTPLDTSAFTGFSNLVLSAGYLTADSNWLFDVIGSAATVQSNLNATWNGSTNKFMGGSLMLTGTVQVASIVWSNVGSTLLTTQTMAGITNLFSTTGAQSFAITNGSVFVTDTNLTLANFAPTTAAQIVTNTTITGLGINDGTLTGVVGAVSYAAVTNALLGAPTWKLLTPRTVIATNMANLTMTFGVANAIGYRVTFWNAHSTATSVSGLDYLRMQWNGYTNAAYEYKLFESSSGSISIANSTNAVSIIAIAMPSDDTAYEKVGKATLTIWNPPVDGGKIVVDGIFESDNFSGSGTWIYSGWGTMHSPPAIGVLTNGYLYPNKAGAFIRSNTYYQVEVFLP
jgi:hypothetical protein